MSARLQALAKKISNEIEFLQGREKGKIEELTNEHILITDYDWMRKKDGDKESVFPCFIIAGDDKYYYQGGSDLTKILKAIDEEGLKEDVQKEGLPVMIHEKIKLKDGNRTFTKYETYPKGWEEHTLPF